MNPKREVRTPKFKMRIVGAGRGKGSYKRQKSDRTQFLKGE
jgi:stalled ribosome alternative rescue factor ArfA